MSGEDIATGSGARAPRRNPRQGVGGSPVGSTLSIILAVVAVIAGFLILNDLTEEDAASVSGSGSGSSQDLPDDDVTTTTFDSGVTTTAATTTTTTLPLVTEGATVAIANGNTIGGSAGRMTETLRTAGFQMGDPTNATSTIDDSIVYFDTGNTQAEAVANSVARALGGVSVQAAPTPAPTDSGSLGDAGVLVVLGNNQADKTLEQLAEAGGLTTELGSSPPVAGGDVVAPADPATTDG